jgi:PAS domain-containing protein
MSSDHDVDQHDARGLAPDLLALAEGSDEMIVALDASFRCTYVNPAAQLLIGPVSTPWGACFGR